MEMGQIGEEICEHLGTKGFCVIESGRSAEECQKALLDIDEMDNMGKFTTPPALIAEGLFGQEGSSRYAEMDAPGDLSTDGDGIRKLDELMTEVSSSINDNLLDLDV